MLATTRVRGQQLLIAIVTCIERPSHQHRQRARGRHTPIEYEALIGHDRRVKLLAYCQAPVPATDPVVGVAEMPKTGRQGRFSS
jgi:hypothetical protein